MRPDDCPHVRGLGEWVMLRVPVVLRVPNPRLVPRDGHVHLSLDEVERFALLEAGPESASFEVVCGKGTYVRALVRDLAERLGVLGYVASLRRLKVGPFDEKHAISLDKLGALVHSSGPEATLLPVEAGLVDIPALRLTQPQAERLRHGQAVRVNPAPEGTVYAMAAGQPVALAEVAAGEARALRVFNL